MRKLRYWGRNWLEEMAMVLGIGLMMLLVFCAGGEMGSGQGLSGGLRELCSIYPYYIIIVGSFVLVMMIIGYFQSYFSLLVSMNARRVEVVAGIMGETAMTVLGILGVSALLWSLENNEIAQGGLALMPLFGGILFGMGGVFALLGAVITKWGKIGAVIFVLICMTMGGVLGAGCAIISEKEDIFALHKVMLADLPGWFNFWIVLAVGVAVYLLAGMFVLSIMRKQEVRI